MEWYVAALLIFGVLLVLLALGVPISFALAIVGIGSILAAMGSGTLRATANIAFSASTNFVLVPLPLFIFMSEILLFTGISKTANEGILQWLGFVPGGLAVSGVATCAAFSAVCGSSPATAATIGVTAVPEMLKRGYDKKLASGCIAAGGALGIIIPPSILMIIYGVVAEQSIGQLFMAGFIPGFLMAGLMMLYIVILCSLKPVLAPKSEIKVTWGTRMKSLPNLLPVVALAALVLGTIYSGVATPTESAALGAFGALCIAAIRRQLTWQNLRHAGLETAVTTSFIFLILIGAQFVSYMLSYFRVPQGLSEAVLGLGLSPMLVIVAFMILYFILGCVMDPASIVLITAPIIVPIAAKLGFDLVWLGILITINMAVANVTPPVGFNLFVMQNVVPKEVTLSDIISGSLPFVAIQGATLFIVMAFPQLALWLPSIMKPV